MKLYFSFDYIFYCFVNWYKNILHDSTPVISAAAQLSGLQFFVIMDLIIILRICGLRNFVNINNKLEGLVLGGIILTMNIILYNQNRYNKCHEKWGDQDQKSKKINVLLIVTGAIAIFVFFCVGCFINKKIV
jgi:uncharacterized membrane protein YidH (DUF202 family)